MSKRRKPGPRRKPVKGGLGRINFKKPINALAASVVPPRKRRRCPTGNVSVAAVKRMIALAAGMPNTLRELALLKEFAQRREALRRRQLEKARRRQARREQQR